MLTAKDLARLSLEERQALVDRIREVEFVQRWRCDNQDCDGNPHDGRDWPHARGSQVPPMLRPAHAQPRYEALVGNRTERRAFLRWYARSGRRWGKTWAASHALAEIIVTLGPVDANGTRREYAVVGTKWTYTILNLMESPSGLIEALGGFDGPILASKREAWNRTDGVLTLRNGVVVRVSSAFDGAIHIQGYGISASWADEVGLWARNRWEEAWEDSILTSTAVDPGIILVTGTPKRGHPLVKKLIESPNVYKVRGSTMENTRLGADFLRDRVEQLKGTARGLQELMGEFAEDVEGAVWNSTLIDAERIDRLPKGLHYTQFTTRKTSWDPSGTVTGDEQGIIVGASLDPRETGKPTEYYVLDDKSMNGSPFEGARAAIAAYYEWDCDALIIEQAYNGQGFKEIVHSIDPKVRIEWAKTPPGYGKTRRAEGAVALYEMAVVHHVGEFPVLEVQMTTWTPDNKTSSPDRMDALAHLLLILSGQKPDGAGGFVFSLMDLDDDPDDDY